VKKLTLQTKIQKNIDYFFIPRILVEVPKRPVEKKSKQDGQNLADLSSAHRRLQAKA